MRRPNPHIERIPQATHGGIDYLELKRLGISPDDVIDFSVSINPFGPPPGIAGAIAHAPLDRYPDSEATELRRAIADRLGLSANSVLVGSGSTEIIRLVAMAYLGYDDLALIPQPTYSDYELACNLAGARVLKPWMLGEADFQLNPVRLRGLIDEYHPGALFLCNPNNPTGQYLSRQEVTGIVRATSPGLVALDEAYVAFTPDPWRSTELLGVGELIIVRSMTKDYALAGLRLGYAVADEGTIAVIKKVKPPWNVSAMAQAAGIFALKAEGYLEECGQKIQEARKYLLKGLRSLGFQPSPSQANFFMVKVGDATGLRNALLRKGIIVRDCTSFGLPNYIRLAPRAISECDRLLAGIDSPEVRHHVS
jgi:histidinol-phosphate aminotransferase